MRRPDIYLGESEGNPPHWGGAPRRGYILGHPALAGGSTAWLVRIEPSIPGADGSVLDEVVVVPRYPGQHFDRMGEHAIVVHILRPVAGVDIHGSTFAAGDFVIEYWADAAGTLEALPQPIDEAVYWQQTLERIAHFIREHGHAQVPAGYQDDVGRLDVLVGNLRWHHAGKGGVSPGPFPGIDYAADLDRLPGWTW